MVEIAIKRVYNQAQGTDGARVLVDKVWPRGVRKSDLEMDAWYKDLAPSTDLRKWFNHDAEKWSEFRKDYLKELKAQRTLAKKLLEEQKRGRITLLYAAKDESHNHALVLRDYLNKLGDPNKS